MSDAGTCIHDLNQEPWSVFHARTYVSYCLVTSMVQAIPGFSSMEAHLRDTLLNLILSAGFLEGRYCDSVECAEEDEYIPLSCRWLSIVQNRSCSNIYNDVGLSRCLSLLLSFSLVYYGLCLITIECNI